MKNILSIVILCFGSISFAASEVGSESKLGPFSYSTEGMCRYYTDSGYVVLDKNGGDMEVRCHDTILVLSFRDFERAFLESNENIRKINRRQFEVRAEGRHLTKVEFSFSDDGKTLNSMVMKELADDPFNKQLLSDVTCDNIKFDSSICEKYTYVTDWP